jgi:transposase-like protein
MILLKVQVIYLMTFIFVGQSQFSTDMIHVFHSKNEFARGKNHVNGIEAFWSFAKRRLAKFNGLNSDNFTMHLKECEFRYNYRSRDLLTLLTKMVEKKTC